MKKYLFSLIAVLGLGLTACEDVPEPYMINTTPSGSGGETGNDSILLSETFSSSLGEFTSVSTVGEYDWLVSYSCAQITSYNSSDKTNNAADSWLISKALDFSDVTSAHINFEYILRYANSAEVNTNYLCLISKDYSGDPASATWTTLNFKPKVGTDWNTWYESGDIAVPAEYCGASSVVVALRYIATTKSATWEVRNFVCARGEAQAGETTEAVATGDGTRANPYNAVAANEVIASGDIPSDKVYVKGKVSSIGSFSEDFGSLTYYISDDGSTSNQFYIYRGYGLGGAKFTSKDELNVGDEVVVYGNLTNYQGTYEMKTGSIIVELNGVSSEGGSTDTGDAILSETFSSSLGSFTAVNTVGNYSWNVSSYNCAQVTSYNSSDKTNNEADSWLISKSLDFSSVTAAHINFEYILRYANTSELNTNYLVLISKDYSGDPASATWTTLNFKPQQGSDWNTWYESGDINIPSDFCGASNVVIALRYIAKTKSATWEVRNLVVSNGEGSGSSSEGGSTTVAGASGSGTEADPYNVAGAQQQYANNGETADQYVVGYIVGYINGTSLSSSTAVFSADNAVKTNLLLADDASCTDHTKCLAIQLPTKDNLRANLNLSDNPGNLGKKVRLAGTITKFCSVTGMKPITAYEFQ